MVQIKKSTAVTLENDRINRINYGFIKSHHIIINEMKLWATLAMTLIKLNSKSKQLVETGTLMILYNCINWKSAPYGCIW